MKFNHFIYVDWITLDGESNILRVKTGGMQVLITDSDSIDFICFLEDDFAKSSDETHYSGEFLIYPDKYLFSVSRSICLVSGMCGTKTLDSSKLQHLVRRYRNVNHENWDCDLLKFVCLFMSKRFIGELSADLTSCIFHPKHRD